MRYYDDIEKSLNTTILHYYEAYKIDTLIKYVQTHSKLTLVYMDDTTEAILNKLGVCVHCLSTFNNGKECFDCGRDIQW